jgi:hypothetical protein
MLKKLIQVWDDSFSGDPLENFLQGVKDSIEYDEIRDEAIRQLHRLTQLEELRRKGVIKNEDYTQKQSEISTASNDILKKINSYYLPIQLFKFH